MVLFIYGLVDNFSYNDYLPKRVMEKKYIICREFPSFQKENFKRKFITKVLQKYQINLYKITKIHSISITLNMS